VNVHIERTGEGRYRCGLWRKADARGYVVVAEYPGVGTVKSDPLPTRRIAQMAAQLIRAEVQV
jgi:hypothetical protein